MGQTGCDAYTDFSQCHFPLEEYNYDAFANKESTRIATHVGWIPFGNDSNAVYYNLLDDQMRSERETLEFLLELYPVLLYHGNLDIIWYSNLLTTMYISYFFMLLAITLAPSC